MTPKKKVHPMWFLIILFGFILLGMALTACSTAQGQDMPERQAALTAAKGMGFDFDDTLISTEYGEEPSSIILSGPMVLRETSADNAILKTQITQVVLQSNLGGWTLISSTEK